MIQGIAIGWAIIATLIGSWAMIEWIFARRLLRRAIEVNKENDAANKMNAAVSEQFINAAKLISIHRNGRLNVFTFARGGEFYTIETFGLLSDQPDEWRKQLGLTTE